MSDEPEQGSKPSGSWDALPFELKIMILHHSVSTAIECAASINDPDYTIAKDKRLHILKDLISFIEAAPELTIELLKSINLHTKLARLGRSAEHAAGPWPGYEANVLLGPAPQGMSMEEQLCAMRAWDVRQAEWSRRIRACSGALTLWIEHAKANLDKMDAEDLGGAVRSYVACHGR